MATRTRAKGKTARPRPRRASEKANPRGREMVVEEENWASLEAAQAEMRPAVPARSTPAAGPREQSLMTESHRDLVRMKKELQVRIRGLELELAGGTDRDPGDPAEPADVPDDGSSIIAMVKELHAEIDAAYELKEGLEADLVAMKNKLSEENAVHAEREARIKLLEAKVALGDQLRRDLAFAEKKRSDTAQRLDEVASQLEKVTEERDRLAEQNAIDATRLQEIRGDMADLETKVSHLEAVAAEMGRLRKTLAETREDLAEAREDAQRVEQNAANLKGKLEATEVAKNAIELDLTTTRELVRTQNEQIDELRDTFATAQADLEDVRAKLEKREAENVNLLDSNKRAEREIETLGAQIESMKTERDSTKQALRDIHAATVRTKRRVQKRSSDACGQSDRGRG